MTIATYVLSRIDAKPCEDADSEYFQILRQHAMEMDLSPARLHAALGEGSKPAREAARLPACRFHALPSATLTCLELVKDRPRVQAIEARIWRDGLHLISVSEYERRLLG
jgi:hypothetical protein